MSKVLLEKMIVEETKDLSLDTLNEILNFIRFIKTQKLKQFENYAFEKNIAHKLSELNKISLVHLEEEFANYKELYPHES